MFVDRPARLHLTALAFAVALAAPYAVAAVYAGDAVAALPMGFAVGCGVAAAFVQPGSRPLRFVRATWPLVSWPLLYDATVRVVEHFPTRYVDPWLLAMDRWILVGRTPDTWPLGGPVEELANLFYASYYAVIPIGAVWAWYRRGEDATVRYALAVMAAFTGCALVWLIAPSGGYHLDGSPDGAPWGPFTALVRSIYEANPHYAAAFPSSHVALAFAAAAAIRGLGGSRLLWVWAGAVAWSTAQGQYHYVVDAPPAVMIGCAAGWWALSTAGLDARAVRARGGPSPLSDARMQR